MKITPEIAEEINELYLKIGVKSKVARIIGCSPSTVSKYIIKDYILKEKRNKTKKEYNINYVKGNGAANIIRKVFLDANYSEKFSEYCALSEEEKNELLKMKEEASI